MRPEGVAAAERELKRANRARIRLRDAADHDDAEDAWADFLTHANKVYLKLRAACYGHPLDWSWWKKKMNERRDDPLLAYIHHARNSDTHRLEDTTLRLEAGKRPPRLAGLYATFSEDSPHLCPLPVVDKGVTYPTPLEHRGGAFAFETVSFMAEVATEHLYYLVTAAASRLR